MHGMILHFVRRQLKTPDGGHRYRVICAPVAIFVDEGKREIWRMKKEEKGKGKKLKKRKKGWRERER